MNYHLTAKSRNAKTGAIPVTTSDPSTCPTTCPMRGAGCYASHGKLRMHWAKVAAGDRGGQFRVFLRGVLTASKKPGVARHNQAGDLPGVGNRINGGQLRQLSRTMAGGARKWFTYTHKPVARTERCAESVKVANRQHIARVNRERGLVVNLSANNLDHADELADLDIGPVVAVVQSDWEGNGATPRGRKVIQCPATAPGSTVQCATCQLCAWGNRKAIIAFPAHGNGKKSADKIATQTN